MTRNRPTILTTMFMVSLFMLALTACSDKAKTATEKKEHFLSEKMETIKKAEEVNQIIQDGATQQRRNIEEQGG